MIEKPKSGRRAASGQRMGAWHGAAKDRDATVRLARDLRGAGKTYVEIEAIIAVPWRTIADWCKFATRVDA